MASLGFCALGSPALERFDWLDHLAWPAVAHVLERCRAVAWMLRQVICVTFWLRSPSTSLRPWSSLDWGLREVRPGAITGMVHVLWGYPTPCIIASRPPVHLLGTWNRRNRTIAEAIARFCGRAAGTISIFHVGIIVLWFLCARDSGRLRWEAVDQDDVLCGFLSHCIVCLCRRGWVLPKWTWRRTHSFHPRCSPHPTKATHT